MRAEPESHALVAHCIVGAVRSFLRVQSVQQSIKLRLLQAMSPQYRAFVVASLNCTHGSAVGASSERKYVYALPPKSCSNDTLGMQEVIKYLPLESFTVVSDDLNPTPSPQCAPEDGEAYEKYTAYYYMFKKAKVCYEQVVQYELDHGVYFDWIVKSRPDDMWLSSAPDVRSLPRHLITVPQHWSGMVGLKHIVEDHMFVIPRGLARPFFNAIDGWDICLPLWMIVERCPFPFRGWQEKTRVMQSECILGHYLNRKNITWQHNAKLRYKTIIG